MRLDAWLVQLTKPHFFVLLTGAYQTMGNKGGFLDKTKAHLPLIILISALFRIPFLANIPNGFFRDEVSYAYDAYSILETGRDRYGVLFPAFVRAFEDYREALYIYLLTPFIKLFGLNEFAVRLPAALIGILTVVTIYFLVKECFGQRLAIVAALFLAISPWHIFYSRICYRLILFPLVFSLALLFFARSFRKPNYLLLSGFLFGLSIYTYISARAFVPLFLIATIALFHKHLWQYKKQTILASLLFLAIFIPLFSFWISPEGMARSNQLKLITTPLQFLRNYLAFFNPLFLFVKGESSVTYGIDNMGILYLFEIITIPFGIFSLVKEGLRKQGNRFVWLFLIWALLYPFPAVFTVEEIPNSLRTIIGAPGWAIISACGACALFDRFQLRERSYLRVGAIAAIFASVLIFSKLYFIDFAKFAAGAWQYGMREAITYAQNSPYSKVFVSDQLHRPYIFILFYTQYPPALYQQSPLLETQESRALTDYSIGKFHVTSIAEQTAFPDKTLLILGADEATASIQQKHSWRELQTIKTPAGKAILRLVEAPGKTDKA
jgi:4-amino-4-deoxy-L-arabinose transferase-like glycosyltransferase